MSSNKQRRESERLRLQRQLEERRQREAARKRTTGIVSIVGALVLVAAIVIVVVVATSGSSSKPKVQAGSTPTPTTATTSAAPTCGSQTFPSVKVVSATGASVTFDGVTVKGAADLKGKPGVTSKSTTSPTKLAYKDLVVGTGAAATPTSCVTIQYDGVLYKTGKEFDSSWSRGSLAQFSLTGVVAGFTQGIGGTTAVPAMRVGGRRLIIIPSALGYGAKGSPPQIPANAPLVFVVDLTNATAS